LPLTASDTVPATTKGFILLKTKILSSSPSRLLEI